MTVRAAVEAPVGAAAVVAEVLTAMASPSPADGLRPWLDRLGIDALADLLKGQADYHWGRDAGISLRLAEAIVAAAALAGSPGHAALGVMARGDALRVLGRYEQSLAALDEAGQRFGALGDEVGWARTRIGRIATGLYLGRFAAALRDADEARAVFAAHGAWLFAAKVDVNAAVVAEEQGDAARAAALYDRAIATYERLAPPPERELASARRNKARILIDLGRLDEALALLQAARAVYERRGETVRLAYADAAHAYIHMLRGEYTPALRLYEEARDALRRHDQAAEVAIAEQDMIACLLHLNQPAEALAQADATLARLTESPGERAKTTALRALALARLGDYPAALDDLAAAEGVVTQLDLGAGLAALALQRAEIYWAQGEHRACVRAARQAARRYRAQGQRLHRWQAALLAARALHALGRSAPAGRLARRYLTDEAEHQVPWLAHTAHHLLGRVAEDAGDPAAALGHYQAAMAAIEAVGSRLLMDLRGHYLADKLGVYRDALTVSLAGGDVAGAYRCAERARARALVEHLAGGIDLRIVPREEADRPLVEELTRLRHERAYYAALIEAHALGQTGPGGRAGRLEPAAAEQALAERERRIAALWQRWQACHPAYAAPGGRPAVPDLPGERLPPDAVLVSYADGRAGVIAFAADRAGLTAHPLPVTAASLDRQVRLLRLNFDQAAVTARDDPAAWGRLTANARALLQSLYRALLLPLAERLQGRRRLIVVPHGALHYLPFAALHDGDGYVGERWAVATLPAGALLRPESPPAPAPAALVLAYDHGGELPAVLDEAGAIGDLFPTTSYLGEQATRAALAEAGPRHALLHLATHAGYRADAPLFSSLFLADGPFDTVDVFNLRLDCSLVTLGACETGQSAVLAGDELIGLSRAFLSAGARSLLLSLWRVDDAATRDLMIAFYRALHAGHSKAEALRQAQAATARQRPHPFFWAAFTLVGEAGPL